MRSKFLRVCVPMSPIHVVNMHSSIDRPTPPPDPNERALLPGLFDKYVEALAEMTRKGFKEATPLRLINKVCM